MFPPPSPIWKDFLLFLATFGFRERGYFWEIALNREFGIRVIHAWLRVGLVLPPDGFLMGLILEELTGDPPPAIMDVPNQEFCDLGKVYPKLTFRKVNLTFSQVTYREQSSQFLLVFPYHLHPIKSFGCGFMASDVPT